MCPESCFQEEREKDLRGVCYESIEHSRREGDETDKTPCSFALDLPYTASTDD